MCIDAKRCKGHARFFQGTFMPTKFEQNHVRKSWNLKLLSEHVECGFRFGCVFILFYDFFFLFIPFRTFFDEKRQWLHFSMTLNYMHEKLANLHLSSVRIFREFPSPLHILQIVIVYSVCSDHFSKSCYKKLNH